MLFRLAELLGMTVERILAEMTVTELNGWILYLTERAEHAAAPPANTTGRGSTGNIMDMDPADAMAALVGRR